MSGGVDSATAAARAVDAGHEVTGVHLALSSNPQSYRTGARGCCTLEDARDARRAADVIGIPFYVWDLAERFRQDVVDDFVAEYAAGRTPNPCLRCNEKIKFEAVLDRALALGFDAVCTGHYARIDEPAAARCIRAVDPARTSPTCWRVLTRDQLAHAMFPLGDTPKTTVRAEAAERGLLVADKPDSHDVCFIADGDTQGFLARQLGRRAGQDRGHRRSGARLARGRLRLHGRPAQGPAARPPRPGRQSPLRAVHRAGQQHRHRRPGRAPRVREITAIRPVWTGCRAAASRRSSARSSSARTARSTPASPGRRTTSWRSASTPSPGGRRRPGGRPLRRRHGARQRHDLAPPARTVLRHGA